MVAARDDLFAELPDLPATFEPGFGAVYPIVYHLGEWSTAPRAFNTAEHRVRLDGYRHRPHQSQPPTAPSGFYCRSVWRRTSRTGLAHHRAR
ncbi:DUF5994 family protein, partial [Nocardia mikamii]|uniref:DUF5994 family protein n=1 Tax=Nocardia mikamii TaxID=508464 RepID=UPI001FE0028A